MSTRNVFTQQFSPSSFHPAVFHPAVLKLKAPSSGDAAASRLLSGCRSERFSIKARIDVVSYVVWST